MLAQNPRFRRHPPFLSCGHTAETATVQVAELSPWSRTTPESSFCQQRIHGNPVLDPQKKGQREHGRFLRFPHNGQQSNVIRAGGAGKQKRTQVAFHHLRPLRRGRRALGSVVGSGQWPDGAEQLCFVTPPPRAPTATPSSGS